VRDWRGADRRPSDGKIKGARCAAVGWRKNAGRSSTSREVRKSTPACRFVQPIEPARIRAPRGTRHAPTPKLTWLPLRSSCRSWRSTARTSAILLAEVPCHSSCMTRTRRSRAQDRTGNEPLDVYDYAHAPARRPRRSVPADATIWTVTDDWPEEVPVTEAEIEVFVAWFGDLFDELFSTRH
jgi:hypothetical protein